MYAFYRARDWLETRSKQFVGYGDMYTYVPLLLHRSGSVTDRTNESQRQAGRQAGRRALMGPIIG